VDKVLSRFGYVVLGLLVGYLVGRFVWKKVKEARDRRRAGTRSD